MSGRLPKHYVDDCLAKEQFTVHIYEIYPIYPNHITSLFPQSNHPAPDWNGPCRCIDYSLIQRSHPTGTFLAEITSNWPDSCRTFVIPSLVGGWQRGGQFNTQNRIQGAMSGTFGDRGRALEDAFFAKKDQQLLEALRSQLDNCESAADKLQAVSGITDAAILEQLASHGMTPETLAAVVLIPLVQVAWADYVMDDREKKAILDGAKATGLQESDPIYTLLASWIDHKPEATLMETWRHYAIELKAMVSASVMAKISHTIIHRSREVALAAGGILGLGNKISKAEQVVLDEIETLLK